MVNCNFIDYSYYITKEDNGVQYYNLVMQGHSSNIILPGELDLNDLSGGNNKINIQINIENIPIRQSPEKGYKIYSPDSIIFKKADPTYLITLGDCCFYQSSLKRLINQDFILKYPIFDFPGTLDYILYRSFLTNFDKYFSLINLLDDQFLDGFNKTSIPTLIFTPNFAFNAKRAFYNSGIEIVGEFKSRERIDYKKMQEIIEITNLNSNLIGNLYEDNNFKFRVNMGEVHSIHYIEGQYNRGAPIINIADFNFGKQIELYLYKLENIYNSKWLQ